MVPVQTMIKAVYVCPIISLSFAYECIIIMILYHNPIDELGLAPA